MTGRISLVGVQSPERPTDPMGSPPVAAPSPGALPGSLVSAMPTPLQVTAKRPNRRLRLWLAMVAGFLALLCLGGVGVVVSLYDGATKIKRTSPDAVVDNFLGAFLVERDDKEASLYECKSGADLTAISGLRNEMVQREKDFHVTVSATWETFTVSGIEDGKKSVSTDLTIAGSSNGNTQSRRTERWAFDMVDQDGWRVCGAYKIA